jgi:hypothetical protein
MEHYLLKRGSLRRLSQYNDGKTLINIPNPNYYGLYGHLSIICLLPYKYSFDLFNYASISGHLNIMKWYCNKFMIRWFNSTYYVNDYINKKITDQYNKLIINTIINGHFDVIKWLYHNYQNQFKNIIQISTNKPTDNIKLWLNKN